jgi:hypothetical protein
MKWLFFLWFYVISPLAGVNDKQAGNFARLFLCVFSVVPPAE